MHVAVVFYGLPPEGGGGHTFQQTLLRTLRDLAPESRHRFTFYVKGEAGDAPRDVVRIPTTRSERVRRVAIAASRDIRDRLNVHRSSARTWLERSLAERGVELVWFASHHVESCDPQPFICTIWDLAHLTTPWFPEVGAGGEWERREHYFQRMLPRAASIVVPNEALSSVITSHYPVGQERLLELPFPTPDFALAPAPGGGDEEMLARRGIEPPYLFYPAQFWAHKNHHNALDALARVNARAERPYQLVLVGSDKGQLRHVHELARRFGVEEQTRFLGFVESDELVALYRCADALLYLSFFGPENLPPLEALALGCPVVCADVPGMRRQLGDAALFAPPTDAEAIAAAIEEARDGDTRSRLVEAGLARARAGTAEEYVQAVLAWMDGFERVRACWA